VIAITKSKGFETRRMAAFDTACAMKKREGGASTTGYKSRLRAPRHRQVS